MIVQHVHRLEAMKEIIAEAVHDDHDRQELAGKIALFSSEHCLNMISAVVLAKAQVVEPIHELGTCPVSKSPELDCLLQPLKMWIVLGNLFSETLKRSNVGVVLARSAFKEVPHQSEVGNYADSFGMKAVRADAICGDPVPGAE
ncbi:MAG: hypothetical protein Q7J84_15570 [Sulfuricaulis sp.]|nr:hypothetical protein [Sulfuricaulis sp.]